MKSLAHFTGKSNRIGALIVCLGLFACMASFTVHADGRGGHGKHHKPPKNYYSQHHHQKFNHDKHWKYRDHRYNDRRYRSSYDRYDRQGFSFNLWSYKPIVPYYRSQRQDYHYHNHGERCYSSHAELYINTR